MFIAGRTLLLIHIYPSHMWYVTVTYVEFDAFSRAKYTYIQELKFHLMIRVNLIIVLDVMI
jgi:hypothetical protein